MLRSERPGGGADGDVHDGDLRSARAGGRHRLGQLAQGGVQNGSRSGGTGRGPGGEGRRGRQLQRDGSHQLPVRPHQQHEGVGCQYAKENGFTNGASNATVSYQAGTTTGSPASGVSTTYWVSYTVSENIWTTFSAVLGKNRTTVSSRATAAVIGGSTGTAAGCMYILDPTAPNALQAGNNATVTSNCGIYVNSNASGQIAAMYATGGAHVTVNGGGTISTRGGYKTDNGGVFSPTPATAATFPGDPFSTLAAPTVDSTCQAGNFTNWQATQYTPAPG